MSTTAKEGEARSIGASKQEALRALINSLVPNGQSSLPDDANMDKLADKLDELLASKGGLDAYSNIPRDDQGRPLNEEGLPIMDIIEPVTNSNESLGTRQSSVDIASSSTPELGQAPLSPLPNWALSPAALAARRRERDRILDILEQEEQEEFAREAAASPEAANRSSIAPQSVLATPPRTLDQAVGASNASSWPSAGSLPINSKHEESSQYSGALAAQASQETPAIRKPKKQKSVSFVDPPSNDQEDQPPTPKPELDWGDVIPVRLDSRKPSLAKAHGVMKELVVERPVSQSSTIPNRVADSDDEDENEELKEAHDVPEDEDSETEVPREALGQLETSDESDLEREEAGQSIDIDDTDFDEAMLQREIALAYYARRNQMGADISSGPLSDSTAMDKLVSRGGNQDEGVIETSSNRFRGSRLPGDPQALINSAVQFGQLVDGELVVNETADKEVEASVDALTGTSNAGKEDMTEKMIELLRRGDTHTGEDPGAIEPEPPIKQSQGETSSVVNTGSQPPVSELSKSTAKPPVVGRRFRPRPNPTVSPSVPATRATPQKPTIPPPPTVDNPMIIESGFGFDPAFQVAPPPKPTIVKAPAPMSERVKERVTAPRPVSVPEKKTSRFAQSQASSQLPAPQRSTPALASAGSRAPMDSDVVERTPDSSSTAKPLDPPKRVSRFRAERSGWM